MLTVSSLYIRGISPAMYQAALGDAVTSLRRRPPASGTSRVLAPQLHLWVSSQAFRTTVVAVVLAEARHASDIWIATPAAILDGYPRPVEA